MNPESVATLLLDAGLDVDTATTMLAIFWAESALDPAAEGDPLSAYGEKWRTLYGPYSCNGHNSFGLGQVFLYWHRDWLQDVTKSDNPCVWADYLKEPANNVAASVAILRSQGLSAWSTFNGGQYASFAARAAIAISAVAARRPTLQPLAALDAMKEAIERLAIVSKLLQDAIDGPPF